MVELEGKEEWLLAPLHGEFNFMALLSDIGFYFAFVEGAPFKKFESMRDEWAIKNRYVSPGTFQFSFHSSST